MKPDKFDGDEIVMVVLIVAATILKLYGFNGEASTVLTGASMYLFGKGLKRIVKGE